MKKKIKFENPIGHLHVIMGDLFFGMFQLQFYRMNYNGQSKHVPFYYVKSNN